MGYGVIRLILGVFWLGVAAVVFVRPCGLADRFEPNHALMVAGVAVLLALWNLSRWHRGRARRIVTPTRLGSRPLRRDEDRVEEYLPEFDFTKRDAGG